MSEFILKASTDEQAEFCRRYSNMQELVRCKDCKHGEPNDCGEVICDLFMADDAYRPMQWFCADGKRRTDDA